MLRESASRHSGYVQNKLRMTVNSGNNSYSINSLLRYFRRSESLGVTSTQSDSQSPYALTQQLSLERLMTRNSIGTRFYVGRNSLELQYAFEPAFRQRSSGRRQVVPHNVHEAHAKP